jgi:hypothetical protein
MKTALNGYAEKVGAVGMLDRDSRQVRAKVVPNLKRDTLQHEILNTIEHKATAYTDGWVGYDDLARKEYIHETVNHVEEYVRGNVHTQGIENFWNLLKRGLNGTYVWQLSRSTWMPTSTSKCFASTIAAHATIRYTTATDSCRLYRRFQGRDRPMQN